MTELVRKLSTGIVGLDIALGGGWRITRRLADDDRQAATMLIRGGPGTGKSALAADLALRLAAQLGGDVVYACVELLPQELVAQRAGFEGFDARAVIDLSTRALKSDAVKGPTLAVGMHPIELGRDGEAPEGSPLVPDVGEMLMRLANIARDRGCSPRVLVLDSLIEGYGLGSSSSRFMVDGVCKLAIEQGWALILIEEVSDDRPSPWAFAVDTVISLRLIERDGLHERELSVVKHRFGPCEPGPHRLRIEPERIRVIPPIEAYRNAHRYLALPKPATGRAVLREFEPVSVPNGALDVDDNSGLLVVVEGPDTRATRPWLLNATQLAKRHPHIALVIPALFHRDDEWLEQTMHNVCEVQHPVDRIVIVVLAPFLQSTARAIQVCARSLVVAGHLVIFFQENGAIDLIGALPKYERSTTLMTSLRGAHNRLRLSISGDRQGTVDLPLSAP